MADNNTVPKKRAPTLYVIITAKLIKGSLSLILAIVAYTLSDNDLPAEYRQLLHHLHFNPEHKFWADLATRVGELTEAKVLWVAAGTLVYSLFSLVEGIGMIFRVSWACWLAIGESAFFIPLEVTELMKGTRHPLIVTTVLAINIVIVWYLAANRQRLFRHHHH